MKCGKHFEMVDPLPLCPECLFGIDDTGVHPADYRSDKSKNRLNDFSRASGNSRE